MSRSLTLMFRRDPSRDRAKGDVRFSGFRMYWPDGREVATGLNAFCGHGSRLLGLDKHLAEVPEKLVEVVCIPAEDRAARIARMPGQRVRRFLLKRQGRRGRLHFIDGTATDIEFVIGRDEDRVVEWVGLADTPDGGERWLDLTARAA